MQERTEHDDIKEMKDRLNELLKGHQEMDRKVGHIARIVDEMYRKMKDWESRHQ